MMSGFNFNLIVVRLTTSLWWMAARNPFLTMLLLLKRKSTLTLARCQLQAQSTWAWLCNWGTFQIGKLQFHLSLNWVAQNCAASKLLTNRTSLVTRLWTLALCIRIPQSLQAFHWMLSRLQSLWTPGTRKSNCQHLWITTRSWEYSRSVKSAILILKITGLAWR